MLWMGDEVGRSQRGNNNAYCHDNEINWLDWRLRKANEELFLYFKHCIAFRRAHAVLRSSLHPGPAQADTPTITWHGTQKWNADWSSSSRTLAFMLEGPLTPTPLPLGERGRGEGQAGECIYAAMNMHWEPHEFELPRPPVGDWHVFANTAMAPPEDVWAPGTEPRLANQDRLLVGDRSVVILLARAVGPGIQQGF
jgi:glycogen operon protein